MHPALEALAKARKAAGAPKKPRTSAQAAADSARKRYPKGHPKAGKFMPSGEADVRVEGAPRKVKRPKRVSGAMGSRGVQQEEYDTSGMTAEQVRNWARDLVTKRGASVEHLVLITGGRAFARTDGQTEWVGLPDGITLRDLQGAVLVHSHPRGTPLSAQDLAMAAELGLSEVECVAPQDGYTCTVRIPPRSEPVPHASVKAAYADLAAAGYNHVHQYPGETYSQFLYRHAIGRRAAVQVLALAHGWEFKDNAKGNPRYTGEQTLIPGAMARGAVVERLKAYLESPAWKDYMEYEARGRKVPMRRYLAALRKGRNVTEYIISRQALGEFCDDPDACNELALKLRGEWKPIVDEREFALLCALRDAHKENGYNLLTYAQAAEVIQDIYGPGTP